ncbi:MAG: DUF4433 domain-containing protein [Bacteroidia bacterium]|nr:DUF4433 domain-containing protein [Bacteroidia bacterium]MBP7771366.1 DUF4433 domain-containing protein [Bacteroidia bacterium]
MTHIGNLPALLQHGLCPASSGIHVPGYICIGHTTLVANRGSSPVSVEPYGTLNDYVPFYFHYKMPMLYQIYKGQVATYTGGQDDVVYLVTRVSQIVQLNLPFIFTDRHAYLNHKRVFTSLSDLSQLSWNTILDPNWYHPYDSTKKELKQAEFLVHGMVQMSAILGIVVRDEVRENAVRAQVAKVLPNIRVVSGDQYYFT